MPESRGGLIWGSILLLIGLIWLMDNLGVIFFDFGEMMSRGWPVVIIVVGIWMLWGGRRKEVIQSMQGAQTLKQSIGELDLSPDAIGETGLELRIGAGEVRLDLTRTALRDKENLIAVKLGLGDIRIKAPMDIPISAECKTGIGDVHLFGNTTDGFGAELKHRDETYPAAGKKLRVVARSGLGDIRVSRG